MLTKAGEPALILGKGFQLDKTKIVVIGESGSGKTELSLNLALAIRERTSLPVHFFDMDQTKPLFRARDVANALWDKQITFKVYQQFMDAPVVPHGVSAIITNPEVYAVLDVGGNRAGALCLGQYAEELKAASTLVLYTINCYRSFSSTTSRVEATMEQVISCCRLDDIRVVSNPFLGPETTVRDIVIGNQKLKEILAPLGKEISLTAVPAHLWKEAKEQVAGSCFPISSFMGKVLTLSKLD